MTKGHGRAAAAEIPEPTSDELSVLQTLSAAGEAFTGARRLEPVLQGLLGSALHLAQADAGSIMLLSEAGDALEVVAAAGDQAEQIMGRSQPVDQSVSGWVMRHRQTLVLAGRIDKSSASPGSRPVSAHPRDLASSVVMPLKVRSRVLGVMSTSRGPGPGIEERTVHLLELLASQAAILIDNAQLAERETATLRERAQLLELAFEAILVRDLATGAVSFWNPGAEVLYGWTRPRAHGQVLHKLLATQFPEPLADVEAKLARDGNWEGELTQRRQDGTWVVVSSRWALQRDELGRSQGVLEINRDITSQKRAATQLQEQYHEVSVARSRVQAVLDATSEAIALLSPDNTTLSVNRRFAELFPNDAGSGTASYPYQEFISNAERLFDAASGFQALLSQTLLAPDVEARRIVVQSWPEHRDLEVYSTPVRDAQLVHLGRLFVFRDVTREQAADRAKSEFISMISHELRTPLTSINGYVDLLLDRELGQLNPRQTDSLRVVRRNGDDLLALINDLLDVSRVMAGSVKLRPRTIDLGGVLEAAIDTLRPQVAAKNQRLSVDIPQGLRPMRGDPQRLTQVFVNLLSNAHKYTPQGGHIQLRALELATAIHVDVADSGIGMTPNDQAQLFTKFFRADHPVTRQVGGTGLGLVITRSLVEMHGGTIQVTSAPDQGSTFGVTLPVGSPAEPGPDEQLAGDDRSLRGPLALGSPDDTYDRAA